MIFVEAVKAASTKITTLSANIAIPSPNNRDRILPLYHLTLDCLQEVRWL